MDATETKVCRQCGKLLPLSGFRSTRWGRKTDVCNACIAEKRADTHYNRAHVGGADRPPFPTRTSTGRLRAKCGG